MTHLTPNLKMTAYNTTLDAASTPVYNYVNQVSGSDTNQNLLIIDNFSASTSASLTMLSASITTLRTVVDLQLSGSGSTVAAQVDTLMASGSYVPIPGIVEHGHPSVPFKQMWVGGWKPKIDDGAEYSTTFVTPTAHTTWDYVAFPTGERTYAYQTVAMPQDYSGSSIYGKVYWTHPDGSGSTTKVLWGLTSHSMGNGESMDAALINNVYVIDESAGTSACILYISGTTASLTVGTSAVAGDLVNLQIFRYGTLGVTYDDLSVEARLIGAMIYYPVNT